MLTKQSPCGPRPGLHPKFLGALYLPPFWMAILDAASVGTGVPSPTTLPPAFQPEHPFQWEFFLHLLFRRTHSNCMLYAATITHAVWPCTWHPPQVPGGNELACLAHNGILCTCALPVTSQVRMKSYLHGGTFIIKKEEEEEE